MTRAPASLGLSPLAFFTFDHLQSVSVALYYLECICFIPLVVWLVIKLQLKPFLASDVLQIFALSSNNVCRVILWRLGPSLGDVLLGQIPSWELGLPV